MIRILEALMSIAPTELYREHGACHDIPFFYSMNKAKKEVYLHKIFDISVYQWEEKEKNKQKKVGYI